MTHLLKLNVAAILCLAAGMWAAGAGAESVSVNLGAAAEPGLRTHFANIELGPREVDGIAFQIEDSRVHVRPGETRRAEFAPTACQSVHFLHFTENAGDPVGVYTLVYADGERVEIPIRCGINMQDWWIPGVLPFATQAYSGSFMNGDKTQPIGFWRFSVRNTRPDVPLVALEVKNTHTYAMINLIAVTLNDLSSDKIGGVFVWGPGMDGEKFLLALLEQPGVVAGKGQACEQLRIVGTVASVPTLAGLLTDPQLSQAARIALAGMPYPEAGAALRDALATTSGEAKAGIVESLGARRDQEAIPLLTPLLQDGDPKCVLSTVTALGKLGGSASIEALEAFLASNSPETLKLATLDNLLRCAETLSDEDVAAAHALYTRISGVGGPDHFRVAAQAGLIRTAGPDAAESAVTVLIGNDPVLWEAALPAVRDIQGADATQLFAGLTLRVSKDVLPGLVEALAQRGDAAASPALARLVEDADPAVRTAAIGALAVMGDGSGVPALVKAAAQGDEADRAAAMTALARMSAADATAALMSQLQTAGPAEAAAIAEALGQRRDTAAAPALRDLVAGGAGARAAAALALAEVGGESDAECLCQFAERAGDESEQTAARRALVKLGERLGAPASFVQAVLAGLKKDNPGLRCTMLAVCGKLRNLELLQALGQATGDGAPAVKDTAIRSLAECEDPGALAYLVPLLDSASDATHRVLVLRGIARLASDADSVEAPVREDALRRALAAAERPEDKRLLLGALGACHTQGALACTREQLADDNVLTEAAMAWAQIAKALAPSDPEAIHAAAEEVLTRVRDAGAPIETQQAVREVIRASAATPVAGSQVRFERIAIDPLFRSEGVAVLDANRDGQNDIVVGDVWYAAPDWKVYEIRPPQTYDGNTGYSQCFANFAMDVDADGWTDSVVIGFPGGPATWYRNPGEAAAGHWEVRPMAPSACGETPIFGDLLGDGHPVPVFAMNRRIAWFRPQDDRNQEWRAYPVSQELPDYGQFGHGLGMGDVNGDGRIDLMTTIGWWEAPEDRTRPDWTFHQAPFGPACANMIVYDVDGDGDNDVITSSAHEYGIWWFEQKVENGAVTFVQHEIYKAFSQTHALILADINNDGLQDLVTGKRYYAHCGHDPGAEEPAMLCWLELQRPEPGKPEYTVHEIDNNSGVGTQFEVCDLDGDGLLDVAASNKKGVHAFLQRRSK